MIKILRSFATDLNAFEKYLYAIPKPKQILTLPYSFDVSPGEIEFYRKWIQHIRRST